MPRSAKAASPERYPAAANGRRVQIAEAALRILAREGARGLTHRAIDRELDLPQGSTSHYCPTRLDLLAATCKRQVELDLQDIRWMDEMAEGRLGPVSPDGVADRLTATLMAWLSPEQRWRTLARSELFLGATRERALDEILAVGAMEFSQRQSRLLRLLDAKNPAQASELLVCFGNGVLYSHAVSDGRFLDEAQLKSLVRETLLRLRDA